MALRLRWKSRTRCAEVAVLCAVLSAVNVVAAAEPDPLRFGVVGFYSPRIMFLKYQPLVDYLSERTQRPWELVISSTYQETVDALCGRRLTMAYLGPFTYVRAFAQCGAVPVVRLDTRGSATYTSVILVREESGFYSVGELEGARFGFGSALSTSSHLAPLAMLRAAGIGPQGVLCRFFDHHERAARAVLLGEVDACGVRDLIGDRFSQRGLRVLARSAPIPNFPLVVAPDTAADLRARIEDALVGVPRHSPDVARRMEQWDEEFQHGFALVTDAEYEPVRVLARHVFGPDALRLEEARLRCGGEAP